MKKGLWSRSMVSRRRGGKVGGASHEERTLERGLNLILKAGETLEGSKPRIASS